ncbi:MFS general substrate transporter [Rhizoctonia solani 123E]|uniref:carnosine N-methyltransferase n=2 Tax=Rhizoctonia solani TaxID=456999 RepID=A0A074S2T3_9AGAM|nr:MFS general substrate transporter [Rhizoctonia solani 123E]
MRNTCTIIRLQVPVSVFYVGYILMQVPSNMFLNYIGKPSLYLPACMVLWGGISCLTGITHSFVPALLTRFFLGFVEAAFFPGALFVLSKWYKREELGLRTAILYCGSLSSNAFGGLLAAGVLDGMEGKLGHAAWRWLFYLEGAITIAVAFLAVFILPDFPNTSSRWLSPMEKRLAELRMIEDAGGEADHDSSTEGPFYGFMLTVKDWKVWWLSVALTAQVVGLSFNSYFPTLTSTLGYNRTISLLLCAPPWAFASVVSFISSRHADKTGERFYHIAGSYIVGIIGFIIAEVTMNVPARYLALFLMAQSYAGFIVFWAWCSNSLPRPPSKRAVALALINAFSQLGNVSGSYVWPTKWGNTYRNSYGICTACFGLTIAMCFMFRQHLIGLNQRLDRGEEIDGIRDRREAMEDAAELQEVSMEEIQQARKGFRSTTTMSTKQTDAELEAAALSRVLESFRHYRQYSLSANQRRRQDYLKLPEAERALLDSIGWKQKVAHIDAAIERNAEFLLNIIDDPMIFQGMDLEGAHGHDDHDHDHDHEGHSHGSGHSHDHDHDHGDVAGGHDHDHEHEHGHSHSGHSRRSKRSPQMDFDMDKVRSTLKQFVRDWGVEGKVERDACYGPMLDALCEYFHNVPIEERGNFRVLVPGAGLGRLAWDVASRGFTCQGNEFSHYMLLASFFVLNRTRAKFEHTIHPFIHSISNTVSARSLLRAVQVPDVLPSDLPPGSNFSLVAGDFEEIYGVEPDPESDPSSEPEPHAGEWDAVLTCFFIDTAKNIISYLKTIHKILAPGGVWINLGPLLWHWENNNTNDMSIELDLEEVKELARKVGFEIYNERTIPTTYTGNSESMLGYVYQASFWMATKIPVQQPS